LSRIKYVRELMKHGSGTKNKYEAPAYAMGDDIMFSLPALLFSASKDQYAAARNNRSTVVYLWDHAMGV
jgi:hypothetical protein